MQYLLLCRSLTYAQRGARALERAGITSTVSRVPKSLGAKSCAYCILVPERHRDRALTVLQKAGLMPERMFRRDESGMTEEVPL